jgi:hypothetical protein
MNETNLTEPRREWQSLVSCQRPRLTRCSGECVQGSAHAENEGYCGHCDGCGFAVCACEEDLYADVSADGRESSSPPADRNTYVHEGERTFGHDDRFEVGDAEAL